MIFPCNVWRIILSFINMPADVYNLLFVNKWFQKELQPKFRSYFVAEWGENARRVRKPKIYKPLNNRSCQNLVTRESVSFLLVEDIHFLKNDNDVAICIKPHTVYSLLYKNSLMNYVKLLPIDLINELDKYFKFHVTLYVRGRNRTIHCDCSKLIDDIEPNMTVIMDNLTTDVLNFYIRGGRLCAEDIRLIKRL